MVVNSVAAWVASRTGVAKRVRFAEL